MQVMYLSHAKSYARTRPYGKTYVSHAHYKKFPYTWRFTFVTDKRKCVTVNSWWRSQKMLCIPRHTFVGEKWTVTYWFFRSSWMNWSAIIAKGNSDEMNHHRLTFVFVMESLEVHSAQVKVPSLVLVNWWNISTNHMCLSVDSKRWLVHS
jgi:hypothetical protein